MIRAISRKKEGGCVVLLGISRRNCEKLVAGQPIVVKVGDILSHLPRDEVDKYLTDDLWSIDIAIMGGETEDGIQAQLEEYLTIGARRDER